VNKEYEIVVILDSTADEAKATERVEKVSGMITGGGGEIVRVERWGRRKLAYEINRRRDGVYFLIRFFAPAPVLKEIEHRLKLDELVLRQMIVLAEEDIPVAAAGEGATVEATPVAG
jgi:small subunit ribosomal protein S6